MAKFVFLMFLLAVLSVVAQWPWWVAIIVGFAVGWHGPALVEAEKQ